MKARCFLFAIIFLVSLLVGVNAQQPRAADRTAFGDFNKFSEIAQTKDITPTAAQQRPILLLLRERELLNAKIEGAVATLLAFLDLSNLDWDVVTDGDAIKCVRRKPPVAPQEGDKK